MHRRTLISLSAASLVLALGCSDSASSTATDPQVVASREALNAEKKTVSTSTAGALEPTTNRHPKRFSPTRRPPSVPDDYVLTHNGFMHPSCVISVDSDETVSHDGTIRGPDGKIRDIIAPCGYDRYSADGQLVTSQKGSVPAPHPHAVYDGWIVFYVYNGRVAAGTTITTDWVVPLAPTTAGTQDIAFFNDIVTESSATDDILQPVLDWNSGAWTTESEHCCINNNDVYKSGGQVSVGDTIRGTVQGSSCSSDGSCSTWTIITQDVTKGTSATLTVTDAAGAPVSVHPAVLETYDITTCSMLPASGKETFSNNSVVDTSGNAQSLAYTLGVISTSEMPSGFPSCGYTGTTSSNNYTLIFSTSVGGTSSTGGASSTGGSKNTGGTMSTGGAKATGGTSSTGGTKSTGGTASTGGAKATGGVPSTGGSQATGGNLGSIGGSGTTSTGGTKAAGGSSATGGSPVATTGGNIGTAGQAATGGAIANTGGHSNTGGAVAAVGGTSARSGGTAAIGGASASAGNASSGGAEVTDSTGGNSSDVTTGTGAPSSQDAGSCSCRIPGKQGAPTGVGGGMALLGLTWLGLRRRLSALECR